MATAFTHLLVGAALVPLVPRPVPRLWAALVLAAVAAMPDLDVIGHGFGVPYHHVLGHRGFSHSLLFAAVVGLVVPAVVFPRVRLLTGPWWQLAALVFAACASHGVLDAFTDAGLGIGFFIPFHDGRFFFPWRPIATSPLDPRAFFNARGLAILSSEIRFIWVPLGIVWLSGFAMYLVWSRWDRARRSRE